MLGDAAPVLGGLLGLTDPGDLMPVTGRHAMHRLAAVRQASEAWAEMELCSLAGQREKHNGWEADVIYWDDMKPKSFKEKLQEETDEWLDKVLD